MEIKYNKSKSFFVMILQFMSRYSKPVLDLYKTLLRTLHIKLRGLGRKVQS